MPRELDSRRGLAGRAAKLRGTRESDADGFTLIELLVVVVIIGILIAIAVPVYLNYRKGAVDKSAASDLRAAITILEQCNGDNNKYPDAVPATGGNPTGDTCTSTKINLSTGSKIQYVAKSDKTNYIAWARNENSGSKLYCYASEAGGAIKQTAATAFPTATYATSC